MERKCIVPGCKIGYKSYSEHVSLFRVPKDDRWVTCQVDQSDSDDENFLLTIEH